MSTSIAKLEQVDNPVTGHPTWSDIVQAEPRLADLLRRVHAYDPSDDRRCRERGMWDFFKPQLERLVGWERVDRSNPLLTSYEPYEVAFDKLFNALPRCRGHRTCTT